MHEVIIIIIISIYYYYYSFITPLGSITYIHTRKSTM